MRACGERGLDPGKVRLVVLTHLDTDHTGGLRHFPRAEVLVHRPSTTSHDARRALALPDVAVAGGLRPDAL